MAKRVSVKGKGTELFFGGYESAPVPAELAPTDALGPDDSVPDATPGVTRGPADSAEVGTARPTPPRRARTSQASNPAIGSASNGASTIAINGGGTEAVEAIRRIVKDPGREVSFVRLTPAEKGELAEVVHAFKRKGVKTTETEINRIAINVLLADHRANGDDSLLAHVLTALRS